jgi:predicted nucleic acid-binding Zn ribbon protein
MTKECPVCGKDIGKNKYVCSMRCYAIFKTKPKTCIVCGKPFKYSNNTTCSKKCSLVNRQKIYDKGTYDEALKKAHETAPLRPLTGRFETHCNARKWKIQSPDGNVYECRNLKLWLRNHADMLDGTVKQAWDGITKIKYSMQGKRKKSYQWKGWKLLEWGEG